MNQLDWDSLATLITEAVLARLAGGGAGPSLSGVANPGSQSAGVAFPRTAPGLGRPARLVWVAADVPASQGPVGLAMELALRAGAEQWLVGPTKSHMASALARLAGLGSEPGVVEWDARGPVGRAEAIEQVQAADRVFVVGLGWTQARQVLDADDRDFAVRVILEALAAGRPVRLLTHPELGGLAGAASRVASEQAGSVAAPLTRKTQELVRGLASMGVELIEPGSLGQAVASVRAAVGSEARARGGLLTAKDVAAAHAEGRRVLELPAGTVITPLARDEARRLSVELRSLAG